MPMKTEGFGELMKQLQEIAVNVDQRTADKALRAGAKPILEQMRLNTTRPDYMKSGKLVHSGLMRASLRIKKPRNVEGERKVTIGIHRLESPQDGRTGAFYANPVEFGHGGPAPAPAHPWIASAYDAHVEESYQEILKVLKKNI